MGIECLSCTPNGGSHVQNTEDSGQEVAGALVGAGGHVGGSLGAEEEAADASSKLNEVLVDSHNSREEELEAHIW